MGFGGRDYFVSTEPRDLIKALLPTNRELKQHFENLHRLYARRLSAEMPTDLEDPRWATLECWTDAFKSTMKGWLEKDGAEWLTKRQLVMVLLAEATALQKQITKEEK